MLEQSVPQLIYAIAKLFRNKITFGMLLFCR